MQSDDSLVNYASHVFFFLLRFFVFFAAILELFSPADTIAGKKFAETAPGSSQVSRTKDGVCAHSELRFTYRHTIRSCTDCTGM